LHGLRLPKALDGDARADALTASLRRSARKLWQGGSLDVPGATWSTALAQLLREAEHSGHLMRGLELIETTLAGEARGLALADARSGADRGSRVSRLLLVSNDGSERFYRQVERLVVSQGTRLLPIRLDADSTRFADALASVSGVVRALLIAHKDPVTRVLLTLYP
jgi:hypothetical protein